MALSPYRNKSSVCRSRSTSFSSPNSRSFHYQEILTAGENALIRSFSCGQFFTRGKRGETLESTQVQIMNFISPIKSLKCKKKLVEMDQDRLKVNKAKLSIEFQKSETIPRKIFNLNNIVYLNLFIFTIFCACYLYKYQYCDLEWKTDEISDKLKQTVFGQDKAVKELTLLLKKFNNSNKNMVISFVGSIGVGKTLVANIVHENFPWGINKHLYFFNSDTEKILYAKTYSSCGANLIIIDNLNVATLRKALDIVEKTFFINSKLLFIIIFQSHNENDFKIIIEWLNWSNVKIHNLVFNDLNHNDVKKCFQVELNRQGKYLPDRNLNEIVNEHMKYCNISKSYLGCKNVFNEISLLDCSV